MGLATEGNNIGVYKAYIKDAKSLKDPTLPPLFSKATGSIRGLFLASYLYLPR